MRNDASPSAPFLRFALMAAAGLLLATALIGCDGKDADKAKSGLAVSTAPVAVSALPRVIETSGTVAPWEDVPVAAETGGLAIADVLVEDGQQVTQGQVLARLNDKLAQAQARQAAANVAQAKAAMTEAANNLARAKDLVTRGHISKQAADAAVAGERAAAARLEVAEAGRAEADVRLAQTRILAPVAGRISARSAVVGQVVQPGQQLFRLIRDGRLEVLAEVTETEIAAAKPGQKAVVRADGLPDQAGEVRLVSTSVDSRTRLGLVYVALKPDTALRPGMFAKAEIHAADAKVPAIPQTAIVWRDGKAAVFVAGSDSLAKARPVTLGQRGHDLIEVKEGLKEDELVVTEGAGFLADGDLIRIQREARQ